MGAAPLRPSSSPSQYSSTVVPSGFSVPMPVTTTRVPFRLMPEPPTTLVPCPTSLRQSLPNLTDEVRLDRLPGDADRIHHGAAVRAAVRDDGHPVDTEERRSPEFAPVHPRSDVAHAAPDQEAARLATQGAGILLAHGAKDEV